MQSGPGRRYRRRGDVGSRPAHRAHDAVGGPAGRHRDGGTELRQAHGAGWGGVRSVSDAVVPKRPETCAPPGRSSARLL